MNTALRFLLPIVVVVTAVTTVACGSGTSGDGGAGSGSNSSSSGSSSGSSSSGGSGSGTGSSSGSGSSSSGAACTLPALLAADAGFCFFQFVDAGPFEVPLPDSGVLGDAGLPAQVGTSCPVDSIRTDTDPCAQFGLACTENPSSPTTAPTAYCGLPGELEPCLTAVGCSPAALPGSPSLACIDGSPSLAQGYVCLYECKTAADCIVPYESCAPLGLAAGPVCFYDLCGPTATEFGLPANGTTYFAPCGNASLADGTCLPFILDNPSGDGGLLTTGLCEANGQAAAGAACSPYRTADGGQLCNNGAQCLGTTLDDGQCFTPCATSDIDSLNNGACGPNCPTGQGCEAVFEGTNWGVCFTECTDSSACGSLSCVD